MAKLTLTQIVGFDPFPKDRKVVRMTNPKPIELHDNEHACNKCGTVFVVTDSNRDRIDPMDPCCPFGCTRLLCWVPRCDFTATVFLDLGRADDFHPACCSRHSLNRKVFKQIKVVDRG